MANTLPDAMPQKSKEREMEEIYCISFFEGVAFATVQGLEDLTPFSPSRKVSDLL